MPAAKTSKGKHLYHTGDDYEEKLQAAKLDVKQQKVPTLLLLRWQPPLR
jgi:hypothetical protein